MKIQLVDRNKEMCDQWKIYFKGCPDVVIYEGDFFDLPTDCVVSPANSFGFMDGGLDAAITRKLGRGVQNRIQQNLANGWYPLGELLVGQAMLVTSDIEEIPYCLSAPTMRVPMILTGTPNVYLAAKAVFIRCYQNCNNEWARNWSWKSTL
jgi:O-acetyl-ADP-ribose deacetylase (regulator of RNase III)